MDTLGLAACWFTAGLLIGAPIGFLAAALCTAGRDDDEHPLDLR